VTIGDGLFLTHFLRNVSKTDRPQLSRPHLSRYSQNALLGSNSDSGPSELGEELEFTTFGAGDLDVNPVAYARAHATPTTIFVDADALPAGTLLLTSIQDGDRFCPLGMNGQHRLISDVLIDRKIPVRLRDRVKVLRAQEDIIWLVGIQQDDRYKVTEKTTTIGVITFRGIIPKQTTIERKVQQ